MRVLQTVGVLFLGAVLLGTAAARSGADAKTGSIKGVVEAKARYLKDSIAYLEEVPGKFPPPENPVSMDQKGSKFIPRMLPILQGSTVRYLNNDMTDHNVYCPSGDEFDLGKWQKGEHGDHIFKKQGVFKMLCQLHPAMLAYVAVFQNPYYAVVDTKTGEFMIDDVPAGTYTLKVWSPRRDGTAEVTVAADKIAEISIKPARRRRK